MVLNEIREIKWNINVKKKVLSGDLDWNSNNNKINI